MAVMTRGPRDATTWTVADLAHLPDDGQPDGRNSMQPDVLVIAASGLNAKTSPSRHSGR